LTPFSLGVVDLMKKIFLFVILFIIHDMTVNANSNIPVSKLANHFFSIIGFQIGKDKLIDIRKKYKCKIKEDFSEGQKIKYCTVTVNYKKKTPIVLRFVSSAIGGWEVITEYTVSLDNNIVPDNHIIIDDYKFQQDIIIGSKKESIINKFGHPTKVSQNSVCYEFLSTEKLSLSEIYNIRKNDDISLSNASYDLYSGIEFKFSSNNKVIAYTVFKIESI
jgi:hypothetical protein